MKIRSLAYHIKDGFKNIHRNKMFSLASIATITACIFLFGVFYSIVVNFQYMIKKAETEVCVTVFFDENLSETDIKKLGDEISKREEVSRKKMKEFSMYQLMMHGKASRVSISPHILNLQKASRMIIL